MDLTVTLPWYPACISPNQKRKLHWRSYRRQTKDYRALAHMLTREAMGRRLFGPVKAVTVTFAPPDARGRDDDNMVGAFKAARDGIAQALKQDDKTWRGKVRYEFAEPHRPDGRIIVKMEFDEPGGGQ